MDISALRLWKEALEKDIEELEAKRSPLTTEIRVRREKLAAIERLLWLEEDPLSATTSRPPTEMRSASAMAAEVAYNVLKKLGEPLHYKPLYAAVQNAGVNVNGKDPATSLIAKIGRDPRFERVGRGTYALAEWKSRRKQRTSR